MKRMRHLSCVLGLVLVLMVSGPGLTLASVGNTQIVNVKLSEWSLGFEELNLEPGRIEFRVVNDGAVAHSLKIQWTGPGDVVFAAETPILQHGETARLIVTLPAGSYDVYCPVPGHDHLGMVGQIHIKEMKST